MLDYVCWTSFGLPTCSNAGLQHEYQIFSQELSRTEDQHIQFVCQNTLPDLANFASNNKHVDRLWRMLYFYHRLCPMAKWTGCWG
jgi:hypothetical protein